MIHSAFPCFSRCRQNSALIAIHCCGMTFRVFLFRSIPVFSSVHLSCFSRVVAACDAFREPWLHAYAYAPVVRPRRQTPRDSLSRTQLSTAHVRSTGSCMNARVFSCDYSFDKRVNKTFLRSENTIPRIFLQSIDNLLLWSVTLNVARGGRSSTSSQEACPLRVVEKLGQSRQGLVFVADGSCGRPVSRAKLRTDRCSQRRG